MRKYTILSCNQSMGRWVYRVFADNLAGFDAFVAEAKNVSPGSTVDIADLKTIFRLRNDGDWEPLKIYGATADDGTTAEEAATAVVLDDIVPDDDLDLLAESETGGAAV